MKSAAKTLLFTTKKKTYGTHAKHTYTVNLKVLSWMNEEIRDENLSAISLLLP